MGPIQISAPVPKDRADGYRTASLWDDRSLADGIEAAAAENPAATALVDNEGRVSYGELVSLVSRSLDTLVGAGLSAGGTAVLVGGNTIDAVVACHALQRLGVTAIVLPGSCGDADLAHAIQTAGPDAVLVAPSALQERVAPLASTTVVPLESLAAASGGSHGEWAEPDRDTPALVLFTSGTTSRPKGVIHSLNTLAAGSRNMAQITGADRETILFLVSPLTSIAGVMQMQMAAELHGTLVLEDRFDPDDSLDRINELGASMVGGAPVIAERLLHAAEARGDGKLSLRSLALGGAMLPMPLLELAANRYGIEVSRVYGSSEAPNSTGSLPTDTREARLADDGALMPGTEIRVGSVAHPQEGLIRGPGVFLGYVDAADNENSFEGEWFCTGDAVELAGNRLTVIGRLKEVVNRSGLKVSLAEVEEALAGLPGMIEYACFGVADDATGERLVAAVRPEGDVDPTLEEVVDHLLDAGLAIRKLPEELVVWRDPFPRTDSGKVVRSRLSRESAGRPSSRAARLE